MATDTEHPDSLSVDSPGATPQGAPPGGRLKIALVAGVPLLVLLLAGGAWAAWSLSARSSESSSEAETAGHRTKAAKEGSKEGKHGEKEKRAEKSKQGAKHGKEAKKGHAKEGKKPAAKEEKKHGAKEEKKPAKHAEPKKNEGKGKQGDSEAKKGHAETKPGKSEEAKHGKKDGKPSGEPGKAPSKAGEGEGAGQQQEKPEERAPAYLGEGKVRLGPFRVKLYDPVTRTLLRVDFQMEGLVDCGDEAAFEAFLKANYHFFREQVMVAVRTCEPVDFTDPGQVLLKRRLIARVNRALRQPFLKAVELKGFEVAESIDNSPLVRWQPAVETP